MPAPKPIAQRMLEKSDRTGECWLWTAARNRDGYGLINASRSLKTTGGLAHRAAWELAHGPIPPGLYVLHSCDNPPCVRADHLFLGSQKDNMRDAARKGRRWYTGRKGTKHHMARLTDDDVRAIRASMESGVVVAARYGVGTDHVRKIRLREKWGHVT